MLVGAVLPPQDTPEDIRQYLVEHPDVLWGVDHLPSRLDQLKAWLDTKFDRPVVMYYHCEAGCDRTGELSAAYYITHQGYNLTDAFHKDTVDCGRAPNYFSKGAIGWCGAFIVLVRIVSIVFLSIVHGNDARLFFWQVLSDVRTPNREGHRRLPQLLGAREYPPPCLSDSSIGRNETRFACGTTGSVYEWETTPNVNR